MQDSIFLRILHFLLVPGKIPNNYIFSLFFHSETNQCSLQFCLDDPIFLIAETAFCQSGFRTFSGIFRSLCIYIFFPLPGCCQHMAGSIHHRKHPADTGCILPAAVFQYNMGFSHAKCRTVIAVSWQNRKITIDCPSDKSCDFSFIQQSVRCTDTQRKCAHSLPSFTGSVLLLFQTPHRCFRQTGSSSPESHHTLRQGSCGIHAMSLLTAHKFPPFR